MPIIATIRVCETTLANPRTHVMIVITIRSAILIIGITEVLPTTTLVEGGGYSRVGRGTKIQRGAEL